MTRWLKATCGCCRGYGLVSDYTGGDFNGPKECEACFGHGGYVVSENDRTAVFPGGPFLGHHPGEFARERAA